MSTTDSIRYQLQQKYNTQKIPIQETTNLLEQMQDNTILSIGCFFQDFSCSKCRFLITGI